MSVNGLLVLSELFESWRKTENRGVFVLANRRGRYKEGQEGPPPFRGKVALSAGGRSCAHLRIIRPYHIPSDKKALLYTFG